MQQRPMGDLQPGLGEEADALTRPVMGAAESAIQPGSMVRSSDGQELGTVVSVQPDAITVKRKRLLGGTLRIPRSLIKEADDGLVELQVPADQIGRG
ncbi:MAG: DUF2171 domain-containing protein [Chloroflexota bacterium]